MALLGVRGLKRFPKFKEYLILSSNFSEVKLTTSIITINLKSRRTAVLEIKNNTCFKIHLSSLLVAQILKQCY